MLDVCTDLAQSGCSLFGLGELNPASLSYFSVSISLQLRNISSTDIQEEKKPTLQLRITVLGLPIHYTSTTKESHHVRDNGVNT